MLPSHCYKIVKQVRNGNSSLHHCQESINLQTVKKIHIMQGTTLVNNNKGQSTHRIESISVHFLAIFSNFWNQVVIFVFSAAHQDLNPGFMAVWSATYSYEPQHLLNYMMTQFKMHKDQIFNNLLNSKEMKKKILFWKITQFTQLPNYDYPM